MSIPTWDEVAEDEFWERVPQDLHEDAVRGYLGSCGDAIDARVSKLLAMAEQLLASDLPGPSIVASTTAIEIMIQYFCVRPIVSGAILSDLLADEVTNRIMGSRSSDPRSLLVPMLRPWGIEVDKTLLPDGKLLWSEFQSVVVKRRNGFAHRGEDVSTHDAALAIECAKSFRSEIVLRIGKKLGFTNEKTGCWSKVVIEAVAGVSFGSEMGYGKSDPFS